MNTPFTIFLIPTVLADNTSAAVLPASVVQAIKELDIFFVENTRTARRFISSLKLGKVIDDLTFFELNKDTPPAETKKQLSELTGNAGIISEAGVPCVADPGSVAVGLAHEIGLYVKPLVGPSSLLLALMGSGFTGQSFKFHGYLPIDRSERGKYIAQMEKTAIRNQETQIFMETPYRNNQMFQSILENCQPGSKLCVAANLTAEDELVKTLTIAQWKKTKPDLNKKPAIFLLGF